MTLSGFFSETGCPRGWWRGSSCQGAKYPGAGNSSGQDGTSCRWQSTFLGRCLLWKFFTLFRHIIIILHVFLELGGLLKFVRPFLISISKAKAARLVRSLLDLFLDMEAATGQEVELCLECIEWAKTEKRTFLRQALEVNIMKHSWAQIWTVGTIRATTQANN